LAIDNPAMKIPYRRVYSDYRTVNGLAVPFRQDEYAGAVLASTTELTAVQFNTGLVDGDFAIPAATGGR